MAVRALLMAMAVTATAVAAPTAGPTGAGDGDMAYHGTKVGKVLFLGNSITKHGPNAKIGWTGNWGMAASAEDKDYAHLILAAFREEGGRDSQAIIANIATFEREHATYDIDAGLKKELAFGADLVILAIGENVPNLATDEAKATFAACLAKLLERIKANGSPVIVVRSCFWASGAKDEILRKACADIGGIFVDAGPLGREERNYARSEREFEHKGVAAHPGDQGMRAIADAILAALRR